jgi:hypothetical protein
VKLSIAQRHALEVVALRKQRLDDDRRAAEFAIRAAIADRTASGRAEYERAVIDADRAGVPKAQIALAVGTSNPRPIREIISRAASASRSALNGRYALGDTPDQIFVHLDGDDLASACESTGWTVAEAVGSGVDRATFRVTSQMVLIAESPSFVVEFGRLSPAVFWIRRNSSEALAWWEGEQL